MLRVYDAASTPYKYGIVIKGDLPGELVDSVSVFRQRNVWYMLYISSNQNVIANGYETHLAKSNDLLHWEKLGKILSFSSGTWDLRQKTGGAALCDPY